VQTPQAAIDRALAAATRDPSGAARELLRALFDGKRIDQPLAELVSAIAERATAVRLGTAPAAKNTPAPEALGDNWFQCPHCAEVFEGESASCKACGKPLAVARSALEITLTGASIWLCVRAGDRRPSGAEVAAVEWMRIETGDHWFELLDEAGRATAAAALTAKLAMPPNVEPIGVRDGDRTYLVHPTKLLAYVVEQGALRPEGKGSATEVVLRVLGELVFPDEVPAAPSQKAIASKGHASNPALEAAILAEPDRPDAYLVLGDWLQTQGDPRGELIALQHANELVRANRLLDAQAAHFFGRLAASRHMLEQSSSLGRPTTWRWGFLEALWIGNMRATNDDQVALDVDEALAALLDHPTCRFLRDLTVGIVGYEDNSYDDIAKVIGERELLALRSLVLGDFHSEETELNWSHMGDVSAMYRAVPNLTSLTLRSGSMQLGAIELPNLESLTIITGGFDLESLAAICNARWPRLTTLSIQLGNEATFTLDHLAPIFDARAFPNVHRLGLGNSTLSDDICRGLAGSKIAEQLVSLDLSKGTLGDDGARALAAGRFPKLAEIDVDQSYLTDEGIAILSKLATNVYVGEQRDDDGDPDERYIAAHE
jgi:uncharacterized protein (TIGR02996 family)